MAWPAIDPMRMRVARSLSPDVQLVAGPGPGSGDASVFHRNAAPAAGNASGGTTDANPDTPDASIKKLEKMFRQYPEAYSGPAAAVQGIKNMLAAGAIDPIRAAAELAGITTDVYNKNAGFADQMMMANMNLKKYGMHAPGTWDQFANTVAPNWLAGWVESSDFQHLNQAELQFLNAILRRQSGATINYVSEAPSYYQEFMPLPGMPEDLGPQKAKDRELALENMIWSAGPAYRPAMVRQAEEKLKNKEFKSPEEASAFVAGYGIDPTRWGLPPVPSDDGMSDEEYLNSLGQ